MSAPSTLHLVLREATRAGHARLDSHPLFAPLGRDDLDARSYGDALLAMHGVFSPLERGLVDRAGALVDFAPRRRVPALEADLAELGRAPLAEALGFDVPSDLGGAAGVVYVVEGSALGGQTIARRLAKRAGAPLPARFFTGDGEAAFPRFRELMAVVEARCPADRHEAAGASAAAVFDAMITYLDRAAALLAAERRPA